MEENTKKFGLHRKKLHLNKQDLLYTYSKKPNGVAIAKIMITKEGTKWYMYLGNWLSTNLYSWKNSKEEMFNYFEKDEKRLIETAIGGIGYSQHFSDND